VPEKKKSKPRGKKQLSMTDWGFEGPRKKATGSDLAPPDQTATAITCTILGVKPRFVSEDASFAIWSATWEAEGEARKLTIQGPLARISSGEMLHCKGRWQKHPRHGWSFRVESFESALPTNATGVAAWLQTRVDGVGPTFAEAIVDHFGAEKVFQTLDEDPTLLRDVQTKKGRSLPEAQVEKAILAWDDAKAIRQIETFLFSHGITAKLADRLYREYGEEVVAIMQEDPYRITEMRGIGFRIADRIALSMGVAKDDPDRLEAGVIFILEESEIDGHVFLPLENMVGRAMETLEVEKQEPIVEAASRLAAKGKIVAEADEHLHQRIYLRRWHTLECRLARKVREMTTQPDQPLYEKPPRPEIPKDAKPEEIEKMHIPTDEQWEIVEDVRNNRLTILSGNPGVGKSATVDSILRVAKENRLKVKLCAPTGKAARRMSELTGEDASTIHRLLEFSPFEGGFQRNENNPLRADLIVVDEASMLSLDLADSLFRAVEKGTHVLLVGDPDQLPPVGVGKVLDDLIQSAVVPRVHLTRIFRQAARSMIIQNSRRINKGELPYLTQGEAEGAVGMKMLNDFYWVTRKTPEATLELTIDMVCERIPRTFNLDPRSEIMVLAPMRKGVVGIDALNEALEERLNPAKKGEKKEAIVPKRGIYVGSRIVQTKNSYDEHHYVMNGELALVLDFKKESGEALLSLDDGEREIWVPVADMDSYMLAWSMSIHRAQGSQWPCVVTPVSSSFYIMLTRSLIYTGVTRASKLCVMTGEKRAISMAVDKIDSRRRNSTLAARITDPALSGELF
jgi:exodeoxyribonuclease V alpha subunit